MFSRHPVGEGLAPPAMSRKCQWFAVGAGLLTRPPSVGRDTRRARRLGAPPYRVSPCGASFFPNDGKETKGSPGEDSHRRREQVPSGSSSFSPGPPFTGDTPIPSCNISGAQNTVPGLIPFGPPGPDAVQNSSLHHFAAAPGSDQPWQRVRVGRTPIRPQWPPQAAPNAKPSEAGLK